MYIPGTTCLHILLAHPCLYYYLLSPQCTVLHILFYCTFYSLFFLIFILFLPIFIYILLCFIFLHCPLSGPVLICIWLLMISCIIEYVMNKRTLNLDYHSLSCGRKTSVPISHVETLLLFYELIFFYIYTNSRYFKTYWNALATERRWSGVSDNSERGV